MRSASTALVAIDAGGMEMRRSERRRMYIDADVGEDVEIGEGGVQEMDQRQMEDFIDVEGIEERIEAEDERARAIIEGDRRRQKERNEEVLMESWMEMEDESARGMGAIEISPDISEEGRGDGRRIEEEDQEEMDREAKRGKKEERLYEREEYRMRMVRPLVNTERVGLYKAGTWGTNDEAKEIYRGKLSLNTIVVRELKTTAAHEWVEMLDKWYVYSYLWTGKRERNGMEEMDRNPMERVWVGFYIEGVVRGPKTKSPYSGERIVVSVIPDRKTGLYRMTIRTGKHPVRIEGRSIRVNEEEMGMKRVLSVTEGLTLDNVYRLQKLSTDPNLLFRLEGTRAKVIPEGKWMRSLVPRAIFGV